MDHKLGETLDMLTVPFSDVLFLDKFLGRNDVYQNVKLQTHKRRKQRHKDRLQTDRETERRDRQKNETKTIIIHKPLVTHMGNGFKLFHVINEIYCELSLFH